MAVCLMLSAYFSATETAFSSANTTRLRTLAEKGSGNAALALKLLEQYDRLLSTILIGNNIVNIATASIGTVLFVKHYGDAGATISTVVVTVVVLIFGEISPKSIAKDCAEKCAMLSAPILQVLIWVLMPLNLLFSLWKKLLAKVFRLNGDSKMSQEELLMLVNEVQQDGSIDRDEGELLKNAIGFSEQEAQDILIHRVDLAALPVTASKEEVAALFDLMENTIGRERTAKLHAHFSHIEYNDKGEVRHLTFADTVYGPDFAPVAAETAVRGYTPTFICESAGTQAEDALAMKRCYQTCKGE